MKETIEAKEKEIVEFNNTINNVRVNKVPQQFHLMTKQRQHLIKII
jgi:hypothetical protein